MNSRIVVFLKQLNWLRPYLFAALIFSLLFVMTFLWQKRGEYIRAMSGQEKLSDIADLSTQYFQSNAEFYIQTLYGLRGLFYGSEAVTRSDFRSYVDSLQLPRRSPAISAMIALQKISSKDQSEFVTTLKNENDLESVPLDNLEVWPESDSLENIVLSYAEPSQFSSVRSLLGFDYGTEPTRRKAFEQAVLENRAVMTDPVLSVISETKAFVLLLPYYDQQKPIITPQQRQEEVKGAVGLAIRREDLFNIAFKPFLEKNPTLQIRVFDGSDKSPERLLYDSNSDKMVLGVISTGQLASEDRTVTSINRTWTLEFTQPLGPEGTRLRWAFPMVFGVLCFALLLTLGGFLLCFVSFLPRKR